MTPSVSASVSPDVPDYNMDDILTEATFIRQTIIADSRHIAVFERELARLLTELGGSKRAKDALLSAGVEPFNFPSHTRAELMQMSNGRIFDIDDLPLLRRATRNHKVTPHLQVVQNAVHDARSGLVNFLRIYAPL